MKAFVYVQFHDGGRNNSPESEIVSYDPNKHATHTVVEAKQREHAAFWGDLRQSGCTYVQLDASNLVDALIESSRIKTM